MLEKRAFDTIDKLRGISSVEELKVIYAEAVKSVGCSAFILCDIPPDAPPCLDHVHASGWHPEWEARYFEQDYSSYDPIVLSVKHIDKPFYWHEGVPDYYIGHRARRIMNEARSEFGMRNGFCIPIHGIMGISGLISLSTSEKNWVLSQRESTALQMVSLYAFEAVRNIRQGVVVKVERSVLSRRELDCLSWIAEGKTNWEISVILGISENTVGEYIAIASRKLGTRSRAHLVARALRQKIIT